MTATEIARALAAQAEAVARHLLPLGRLHKGCWHAGSIRGEPGMSLRVNLSGSRAGVWCDFAGADDDRGDLIGLWQKTRGLSLHDACEEAQAWLGGEATAKPAPMRVPMKNDAPPQTWLRLQKRLRPLTLQETRQLAALRRLPVIAGLELAARHGQLFYADVFDDGFEHPCWLITDSSRLNAQARRLDGRGFDGIGGKKAKTIRGAGARHPIGLPDATLPNIALVEGAPDLLAAWTLIHLRGITDTTRPVAMLGAANAIPEEALPSFAGKNVFIYPHADDAGKKAGERWAAQIIRAGGIPRWCEPVAKDLNEMLAITAGGDK